MREYYIDFYNHYPLYTVQVKRGWWPFTWWKTLSVFHSLAEAQQEVTALEIIDDIKHAKKCL